MARFADASVEVRESHVEGVGVFAVRDFSTGERVRVVSVVREITAADPLRPEAGERREHCSYADGRVVLLDEPNRYYNHSCDPNAWVRYVDDRSEIVARRPIAAGEEIRVDYLVNNGGGESWPCGCGASRCRGKTSVSFFTLPPDQQREYLPLLADWFVLRHRHQMAELLDRLRDESGQ